MNRVKAIGCKANVFTSDALERTLNEFKTTQNRCIRARYKSRHRRSSSLLGFSDDERDQAGRVAMGG